MRRSTKGWDTMMITDGAAGDAAGPSVAVRGSEVKRSFRDEALAEFDMLYRIAVQLTSDRPSAKRLLEKTILTAYRSWEDRPDELEPRVWIAQVLVREHRCLFDVDEEAEEEQADRWARAATFLNEAFMDEHARAAVMRNLRPAVVRRAIGRLPQSARRVLALSDIAGFSYSQLASVLDSTVCEVKKRLHAARDLVKWILATDMKQV
ncbi:MAG: sigma factor-like helix-turn-helix DNA-binding protein [Longimicrobiales bacterium]